MIRVCVEIRGEDTRFRVVVRAESIARAISLIEMHNPGGDARVVFPIDPEGFFLGGSEKTRAESDESRQLRSLHGSSTRL